jgi:hypothetical protein
MASPPLLPLLLLLLYPPTRGRRGGDSIKSSRGYNQCRLSLGLQVFCLVLILMFPGAFTEVFSSIKLNIPQNVIFHFFQLTITQLRSPSSLVGPVLPLQLAIVCIFLFLIYLQYLRSCTDVASDDSVLLYILT